MARAAGFGAARPRGRADRLDEKSRVVCAFLQQCLWIGHDVGGRRTENLAIARNSGGKRTVMYA